MADSTIGDSKKTDLFYPCQSQNSFGQFIVACERVPMKQVKNIFTKVQSPYYHSPPV